MNEMMIVIVFYATKKAPIEHLKDCSCPMLPTVVYMPKVYRFVRLSLILVPSSISSVVQKTRPTLSS
jgi:hypothetical protein